MLPRPCARLIFAVMVAFCSMLAACNSDEPLNANQYSSFKFTVTEHFVSLFQRYVIIVSDREGGVISTTKINAPGIYELEVPDKTPERYHITVYDGEHYFRTFASLPFGEYLIDFPQAITSPAGTHFLSLKDPTILLPAISGEHLESASMKIRGEYNLLFNEPSSDLYLLSEKDGEPSYLYFPTLNINQSTIADFTSGESMVRQSATILQDDDAANITLRGSTGVDNSMEYYLSNSNGRPFVFLPSKLIPRIRFFSTIFVSREGSYTSVNSQIARQEKALNANVTQAEATASSVSYSIESAESIVQWSGSSPTEFWEVISPTGKNITVNLPQLSDQFKTDFAIENLGQMRFGFASVTRDTRYHSYADYTQAWVQNNFKITTTPYEQFSQYIPL